MPSTLCMDAGLFLVAQDCLMCQGFERLHIFSLQPVLWEAYAFMMDLNNGNETETHLSHSHSRWADRIGVESCLQYCHLVGELLAKERTNIYNKNA